MKNMVELRPVRETTEEYERIERRIKDLFRKEIYLPLIKEMGQSSKTLKNANVGNLNLALQSGRIQFYRGVFSGKFNAAISKDLRDLGAKWDWKTATFRLASSQLPLETKMAISSSVSRFAQKLEKIDRKLASVIPEQLAKKLKLTEIFDRTLFKTESSLSKTMKGLVVTPTLTPEQRERIANEWQLNMELWIKDFLDIEIVKLRSEMQKTVFAGNRYETAVQTIKDSYGVSERKAKFLARQETNLLVTKYKEIRYQDAGIDEYKWHCVTGTPLHPVRPMHKELNDQSKKGTGPTKGIFKFSDPPIDDPNGSRHNPGQNYNCRCVSIPIVRFRK